MDGGVLAGLDQKESFGILEIGTGRKTSAVHVLIRYTMVLYDVNRTGLYMVGPRQNDVISRFKVSSPT